MKFEIGMYGLIRGKLCKHYFDELLDRIRDIRSSEKVFWRKVLDIYATSVDYNPNVESTKQFFQTIQNKMHWPDEVEKDINRGSLIPG